MIVLFFYLLILNITAALLMGIDKRRAIRHQRRIPERTLMATAALGGSLGALWAMAAFRHKTRHNKFRIGLPALLLLQLAALFLLLVWKEPLFSTLFPRS